ncbi:MAG: hypothetical protein U1F25_17965 [Rubrivivax sp.]
MRTRTSPAPGPARHGAAAPQGRLGAIGSEAGGGTGGEDDEPVRFSADFAADVASLLESARALGLEGIIAKRADAPYVSQRSDSWLKLKIAARQELVIGGFTVRQGATGEVGSLILGVYDSAGRLEHAGSVGTGWDSATAAKLFAGWRRWKCASRRSPPAAPTPALVAPRLGQRTLGEAAARGRSALQRRRWPGTFATPCSSTAQRQAGAR